MPNILKAVTVQEFREIYNDALWLVDFTDREIEEILLALYYTQHHNHGTSGHLAYNVIAKLAKHLLGRLP